MPWWWRRGDVSTTCIAWAMAAGVAVIGAATYAVAELASHKVGGLLFKPPLRGSSAPAVVRLLRDREAQAKAKEVRGQAYEFSACAASSSNTCGSMTTCSPVARWVTASLTRRRPAEGGATNTRIDHRAGDCTSPLHRGTQGVPTIKLCPARNELADRAYLAATQGA